MHAFGELTNVELARSWGEPGIAGNDIDIVSTCRLFGEVCASTLAWEEEVRFSSVDECFTEVRDLFIGVAGTLIENAEKIPEFLTETIAPRPESGEFKLSLTISTPDGWSDAVSAAMERVRYNL